MTYCCVSLAFERSCEIAQGRLETTPGLNMAQPVVRKQQLEADEITTPQVAEIRYENTIAHGNSRNVYGNVINTYYVGPQQPQTTPKPTTDTPSTNFDDIKLLLKKLEFKQMDDRFATIMTAQIKTCQWFFEREDYRVWRSADASRDHRGFLWLKGKPGAGKSTLMKSAQRHGEREYGDLVLSFFFNARGVGLQRSTQGMYRSLLYQMLKKRAKQLDGLPNHKGSSHRYQLLDGLLEGFHGREARSVYRDWPVELLKDMLRDFVLAFSPARVTRWMDALDLPVDEEARNKYRDSALALARTQVTCYVDALDECEDHEARDVIEFLGLLRAIAIEPDVGFRVLLSSRHYPHITFDTCQHLTLEGQKGHEGDIAEYIRSKLRIGESDLALDIELSIQARASGVFLWVVLVVRIMNDLYDRGQVHRLRQRLKAIPSGLHQLFEEILQKDTHDGDELLLVFQWLLFSLRPLELQEFYHAVRDTVEPDDDIDAFERSNVSADDMTRFLLDASKGLAEMTKGAVPTVQFIHESVKEYLLGTGLLALKPSLGTNAVAQSHARLQECCLRYLKRYQTVLPSGSQDKFDREKITKYPNGFLKYAVRGMLYHADSAHSHDDFIAAFPHHLWRRLYNVTETNHPLSEKVASLYIFILTGAVRLAKGHINAQGMPRQPPKQVLREYHRSLLGPAVDNGDESMAKMLLGHGIGANWPARAKHTCLSLAVEGRDARMVQILLDAGATADPGANDPWGSPHLGVSLHTAPEDLIIMVLRSKYYATLWHRDFNYILYEADYRDYLEVKRILMSRLQAMVNEVPSADMADLESALLAACMCNMPDLIAPLIEHGADLSVTFAEDTGLSIATERCYTRVVQILLELGADPNIPNKLSRYPIHDAAGGEQIQLLRILLEFGANPCECDGGERSPLHIAAMTGQEMAVRLLIKHGTDTNALDRDGFSALVEASWSGNMDVVDVLLEAGDPVPTEQLNFAAQAASNSEVAKRVAQERAKEPTRQALVDNAES